MRRGSERRGSDLRAFDRSGIHRGPDGVARYSVSRHGERPESLIHALRATVDREPGTEAIVEVDGPRWTYRQLWDRAAAVAAGLRDDGVRAGERVLVALPSGADWCAAFYGVLLAGAVAVPVNPRSTGPEIAHVRDDAGAVRVLEAGRLPAGRSGPDEPAPGANDVAAIFYTSGTTGRPKGAVTTHANFLANTETARRVLGIDQAPVWRSLVSVPLHHVTGCNSQLLPACEVGGTTVVLPRFDVARFLRTVEDERITALMSVPSVYQLALAARAIDRTDTSAVRSITYGGAPMPPDVVTGLRTAFPKARLGSGYGLTETASFTAYLPHEQVLTAAADVVGFPVPVVDLALSDPAPDGVGELLVRGPNVVRGYWNNPDATARTFGDGWLRTGDLARIDEDGAVHLVDRAKDMIVRGGENVYSAEVERVFSGHPDVVEVAVVAVPDRLAGERVAAAVVLRPGDEAPPLRPIWRFVREHLARYKVPDLVAVWRGPLPRNPGGKVDKAAVRATAGWRVAPR
ncbi:class I adenylate-forming enzyme family protein [Cryptosporangium aurantiacum]|uniref:Acyl-CoA synthetase (AMP-forming)/AMP-acid ligase II n=1 Tax=Cryptosporangium aurantiacum TaxID=134849 RepID=A0A1M7RMI3_9ACTN|nr:AMP-binding protein [Cryptosporangium aurantiacum]SHN47306.1 Acyl-CoA synthetase (AMP-forming)/AMP-acid ligase II [Cryptosporangium aurantiacum]